MLRAFWNWLFGPRKPFGLTDAVMEELPQTGSLISGSDHLRLAWEAVEGEYVRLPRKAAGELWDMRSRNGHPETMSSAIMYVSTPGPRRSGTWFLMQMPESLRERIGDEFADKCMGELAEWWARWRPQAEGPFKGDLDDLNNL